jgi:hypothetical protein
VDIDVVIPVFDGKPHPPSESILADKINELVDAVNELKAQSGR